MAGYISTLTTTMIINGKSFPSVLSVTTDGVLAKEISVPAAKIGQLTTRTDADTGTLTMESGHGITTGVRLDLYWAGGSQRGITVGTVSSNSVPFDAGTGDDLPDNLTAITAMVPLEETLVFDGDDVSSLGMYGSTAGTIVFAKSDDSEVYGLAIGGLPSTNQSYAWMTGQSATNPLAAGDVAKVFFSHGSSAGAFTMGVAVGVN